MPVAKRGIVFRYFDKVILVIAVLGLLAALGYGFKKTRDMHASIDLTEAETAAGDIERMMGLVEEVPPVHNFVPDAESALQSVPPPNESLRPWVFWPPYPDRSYEELRVGTDRDIVLEFHEPITPESFQFVLPEGIPEPLTVLQHPYEGDFSKVAVRTLPYPESRPTLEFTFMGKAGKVQHEWRIVLDRTVDKTPYPPVDLVCDPQPASVLLEFKENEAIKGEDKTDPDDDVDVAYYDVLRLDLTDPLADYESVGRVVPEDAPAITVADILDPGEETDEKERTLKWVDTSVKPGGVYSYKVRTVGKNTFPEKGNLFTDEIKVTMLPMYDIRPVEMRDGTTYPIRVKVQVMRIGSKGKPGGDIPFDPVDGGEVRPIEDADAEVRQVWVSVGDAIDAPQEDAGTGLIDVWHTGITLLECRRNINNPTGSSSDSEIIFIGPDGKIETRWSRQLEKNTEGLWKRVEEGARR